MLTPLSVNEEIVLFFSPQVFRMKCVLVFLALWSTALSATTAEVEEATTKAPHHHLSGLRGHSVLLNH